MKNTLFFSMMALLFFAGSAFFGVQNAKATTVPPFMPGCASAIGYSSVNGKPCSGTDLAIAPFMSGCPSIFGYSATTGKPCDGISFPISYMDGCNNTMFGYSATLGQPCNGTTVATFSSVSPPIYTPVVTNSGVMQCVVVPPRY